MTVQAGIRVQQLAEALAEHGLTLENFASIQEQQVGDTLHHNGLASFEELKQSVHHCTRYIPA